jgi:hypothetical protein
MVANFLEQFTYASRVIINLAVYFQAKNQETGNLSNFVIWYQINQVTI